MNQQLYTANPIEWDTDSLSAHFTCDGFPDFNLAVMTVIFLQHFAHITTAQLICYSQNFMIIP